MSQHARTSHAPTPAEFVAMNNSQEFETLKSTFRRFAFPISVLFLAWYLIYIIVATFAVDLMATYVWGNINVGMALGILQFVTTGIFTWLYVKFMGSKVDPLSENIREMMTKPDGDVLS